MPSPCPTADGLPLADAWAGAWGYTTQALGVVIHGVFGECASRGIQTPDRLHMGDATLAGLAFVYINKGLYNVSADDA